MSSVVMGLSVPKVLYHGEKVALFQVINFIWLLKIQFTVMIIFRKNYGEMLSGLEQYQLFLAHIETM